ncbi:MAG: efflux RND transporter periplasmic adaptor subunit [Deltaproteobacteria bacterium]
MTSLNAGICILAITVALSILPLKEAESQAPPPAPVVVDKVAEETLQKPVNLVGAVEPDKRSLIASEIEGMVESFPVEQGQYVEKGELIAQFNTRTIEIQLKEARASKSEAQARYQLAQKNLARFEQLQTKGVASVQQFQDAETEKQAWGARRGQLQAQIENREYDLEKSRITAPFSGYVTAEHTEVGEWVDKGGPIVEMINTDTMDITIDMPERYVSKINKGQRVSVNLDALPEMKIEGEVTSIVPQADREARTFPVKITVNNEDGAIKSGMVARVSFPIGEPSTVKMVPKDAIVSQNNANFIYVVNEGAVQPLPVSTGMAYEDRIEVIGPVQKGMTVVVKGNERLMPNQPVKIVNDTGAPQQEKIN